MAVRDIFKISRKTFFNPSAWLDAEALAANSKNTWGDIKGLFTAVPSGEQETFDEAASRLKLSAADIKRMQGNYFMYALVFASLGVLSVLYSFYLLFHHNTFHGWILALASAALFFSQGFRFHFWCFQIKHRKLGCTIEEWRRGKPFDKRES